MRVLPIRPANVNRRTSCLGQGCRRTMTSVRHGCVTMLCYRQIQKGFEPCCVTVRVDVTRTT